MVAMTILYWDNFDVVKVALGSGGSSDDENNKNHKIALPDIHWALTVCVITQPHSNVTICLFIADKRGVEVLDLPRVSQLACSWPSIPAHIWLSSDPVGKGCCWWCWEGRVLTGIRWDLEEWAAMGRTGSSPAWAAVLVRWQPELNPPLECRGEKKSQSVRLWKEKSGPGAGRSWWNADGAGLVVSSLLDSPPRWGHVAAAGQRPRCWLRQQVGLGHVDTCGDSGHSPARQVGESQNCRKLSHGKGEF